MIFGLLPVKLPRQAKQRLSQVLSPEEREQLARAMFIDVLPKLLAVRSLDRVMVASNDHWVLDHAEKFGANTLKESRQQGHSVSADWAVERSMALGASTVLIVPIDVPLATPEEFESLLQAARDVGRPGLVIVPSADGMGTNALVRTPPDLIRSRFGPGSFAAHVGQARKKGAKVEVVRPPGVIFDIDTPEDLALFEERACSGAAWEYLRSISGFQRAHALLDCQIARE